MGKRAPRDWTWERTARELFGELDRLRRAEVYDLFEAGQKAEAAGDLVAMRKAFDEVLVRAPFFERGDEMVGGYWEYAKKYAREKPEDAIAALRRAERLGKTGPAHDRIESLLLTLEANRLAQKHVVDRGLYRRALELDGENTRARDALSVLSRPARSDDHGLRYLAAASILGAGLLGAALIFFRRKPAAAAKPEASG
jgi:hypothetical protein